MSGSSETIVDLGSLSGCRGDIGCQVAGVIFHHTERQQEKQVSTIWIEAFGSLNLCFNRGNLYKCGLFCADFKDGSISVFVIPEYN